ncbi:hypothetical protein KP509_23G068900 [Ceratopteris richardii]|uniref:Uncharacterized protein n=1 Tax=Ceratopteris richardii TaxID=49495 RepID=A0A8T2S3X8_CERRI|nr:hypothetical protein KP509_23G068900 [Ceratopteris richardii]
MLLTMMLAGSSTLALQGGDGARSSWRNEKLLGFSSRLASRDLFGRIPLCTSTFLFKPLRYPHLHTSSCVSEAMEKSSSVSYEELRTELEALNEEAEQARGRANAARARFMRLTERVENLRMQAITDLKAGKEGSARQLLFEKQKVMQALEKSKQRAELLEELCNKLGEAISRKELQVITSLTSTEVEVDEDKTMLNVRIVSPKGHNLARDLVAGSEKIGEQVTEGLNSDADSSKNLDSECSEVESGAISDARESNNQSFDTGKIMLSSKPETYPEFLFNVDKCLQQVEAQLHEFLNIAAMILPEDVDDGNGNPNRVAVVRDIWQDVHTARQRSV